MEGSGRVHPKEQPQVEKLLKRSSPPLPGHHRKAHPKSLTNSEASIPDRTSFCSIQDLGLDATNSFFQTIASCQGYVLYRFKRRNLRIAATSISMEHLTGYTTEELLQGGYRRFSGKQARDKAYSYLVTYLAHLNHPGRGRWPPTLAPRPLVQDLTTRPPTPLMPTLEPIVIYNKAGNAILANVVALPLASQRDGRAPKIKWVIELYAEVAELKSRLAQTLPQLPRSLRSSKSADKPQGQSQYLITPVREVEWHILKPPVVPIRLDWNNLNYTVEVISDAILPWKRKKKGDRTLLSNVTGFVSPGELLIIMGPTGCGKTTLLNALALRLRKKVTGELLYNGHKPVVKEEKHHIGYVLQDDLMFPFLTVQQTLDYTAQLRQPSSMTAQEKSAQVKAIIEALNLTGARNTIIGGTFRRGVSGGERKRVNIATQLLSDPSVIFLDECTSGLDTSSAFNMIKVLRSLAGTGYTVVATIHQPSSQMFELFDRLLFLVSGNVIYFGPANLAVEYFDHIGFPCPPTFNPADFIMGLILQAELSGKEGDETEEGMNIKDMLVQAWKDHGPAPYQSLVAQRPLSPPAAPGPFPPLTSTNTPPSVGILRKRPSIRAPGTWQEMEWPPQVTPGPEPFGLDFPLSGGAEPENPAVSTLKAVSEGTPRADKKYAVPWLQQFGILTRRGFRNAAMTQLNPLPIIQMVVVALLIGLIWIDQRTLAQNNIRDRVGALFFIGLFAGGFTPAINAVHTVTMELPIIVRERLEDAYPLSAYYLSKVISELPFEQIYPLVFVAISYWLVGLRSGFINFFVFVTIVAASNFAAAGLGMTISVAVGDIRAASVLVNIVILLMLLTAGFYIPTNHIPGWLSWLQYTSFVKYTYDGLVTNEFAGRGQIPGPLVPFDGDDVVDSLNVFLQSSGAAIAVIVGFGFVFRTLAFVSLWWTMRRLGAG